MAKTKTRFWTLPVATRGNLRSFGVLMAVVFGAVSGLLWYRGSAAAWPWTAGVAALFLALGGVWPTPLKPLWIAWMSLARGLGFVNSHLLLAIVFYGLFTPMGLVMRAVRRDPLERGGFRPTAPSCRPGAAAGAAVAEDGASLWKRRDPEVLPREHFEHQF
ncbi:MAG: SxtJ family membrane protein [Planctomycetota bacterium]|jgi:hypothetical protein